MSGGSSDVDNIIANSWNKIFTSKAPFFDEEYRSILCQKILKHYYLREICCETVGIWTLWMNTRLEEIMPYYNQLYESAKIKFNPMHDVDLTRKHDRIIEGTSKEDGTRTDNTTGKRRRKTAGLFGGRANYSNAVPRCCFAVCGPSFANSDVASRFRCELVS